MGGLSTKAIARPGRVQVMGCCLALLVAIGDANPSAAGPVGPEGLDSPVPPGAAPDGGPVTVLRGETIFGLESLDNLERVDGEPSNGANVYFGYRLRLNIDTSFFGRDRLRLRLQSRTIPELEDITGSSLTNLAFDGDSQGVLEVSDLWYRFPLSRSTDLSITAIGGSLRDNVPVVNPLFYGSSRGSISVFGSEDPIIRSRSGAALGLSTDITPQLNLSAAVVSSGANESDYGIFGDRNAAILQATYASGSRLRAALSFTRSNNDGSLGSEFVDSETVVGSTVAAEVFYRVVDGLALGLRGGLTQAQALDLPGKPQKRISSYALTVGFPDLFGRGNLLGLVVGRPPAVMENSETLVFNNQSGHLELFYRYTVSDQLSITPGVMRVRSPDDFGGSNIYWIGALRMTFRF